MEEVKSSIPDLKCYNKYYGHDFHCDNCGHKNRRYIKKGKRIESVVTECDNCGCSIHGRKKMALAALRRKDEG